MDWHPVISVQKQTPDNDFCHFSISNVRCVFWAFFRKLEKLPVSHRVKMMTLWPGCERWPKWHGDPMTHFHVWSLYVCTDIWSVRAFRAQTWAVKNCSTIAIAVAAMRSFVVLVQQQVVMHKLYRYEAMNGSAKCRKWGGFGRLGSCKLIRWLVSLLANNKSPLTHGWRYRAAHDSLNIQMFHSTINYSL